MAQAPEKFHSLFERGSVSIQLRLAPTPQIVALLKQTVWGTKGSRYTHLHIQERINQQLQPYFVTLEKSGELLAVICVSYRVLQVGERKVNGYYVRYFAFNSKLQTKDENQAGQKKQGFFRSFMMRLFQQPLGKLPLNYGEDLSLSSVYYAYVDVKNVRSAAFIKQMGFEDVGSFDTGLFTRFNPKKQDIEHLSFQELRKLHGPSIEEPEYAFYSQEFEGDNQGGFALTKNGKTLVACRVSKALWRVESTGSKVEDYIIKQLQIIPALKKAFDPERFSFLVYDYLYASDEATREDLISLFEGVLKQFDYRFGMYFIDEKDKLSDLLSVSKGSGLIASSIGSHKGGLVAQWTTGSEAPKGWDDLPWFFHALDAT